MAEEYFQQQPTRVEIEARMAELGAWFKMELDHIVHNLRTTRDQAVAKVEVMTLVKKGDIARNNGCLAGCGITG